MNRPERLLRLLRDEPVREWAKRAYLRLPLSPEHRHRIAISLKRLVTGTPGAEPRAGADIVANAGALPPSPTDPIGGGMSGQSTEPSAVDRAAAETASPPQVDFALEPGSGYRILTAPGEEHVERWRPPLHLGRNRPAFFLKAGETLLLPPLKLKADSVLRLRYADGGSDSEQGRPPAIEVDVAAGSASQPLLRAGVHANRGANAPELQTALTTLPDRAGRPITLRVRCVDRDGDAKSGRSIALLELVAGQAGEIDLLAARTFRALRIANERQHFSEAAYEHPMYVARRARIALGIDAFIPSERSFAIPGAVENAFDYALARLCCRLQPKAPDFERRLREISARRGRLAVLSVGTGQGLVEAALFHAVNCPIDLTIVDVNDDLMRRAAGIMPAHVTTRRIEADANSLPALPSGFDIAMCVSGVHHLVELGAFFLAVRNALSSSGELWLIGEQIGPCGNRLEPDALARANELFARLPARLRRNYYTGEIDAFLGNPDQADATFEGIRSDAIEAEVARFFSARHVVRRNCILWRMVWPEYVTNYSLQQQEDVKLLDWLVEEEVAYFLAGGRPTELEGIYAPLQDSAGDR